MDFDRTGKSARARFEALAVAALAEARGNGARMVPLRLLEGCRYRAVRETAASLTDAELLGLVATRPALLDLDERTDVRIRSPRDVLRLALANALSDTLCERMEEIVSYGQDADTLPAAVAAALAALDGLEAEGVAYPLLDTAREVLGEWGEGASTLALHACAFLDDNGRRGPAQDLEAAIDGREILEGFPSLPGLR